jgi:hypothetical protein
VKRPEEYVGLFRHPDGSTVHVMRVEGRLFVYTDERPGVVPDLLGEVTGRDLVRWEKIAADPF